MKTSWLVVSATVIACWQFAGNGVARGRPEVPRVLDEASLAEWATPVAGLNLRPSHMSANEYYSWATVISSI